MDSPIRVLHVGAESESIEYEGDRLVIERATSAGEGLDRLTDTGIDCIVGDDTTELDGIAFLETVREERVEIPFILVTEDGSEAVASGALSETTTDYLQTENGQVRDRRLVPRIVNIVDSNTPDRERRQIALKALHDVATTLQTEDTIEGVCERTVTAAADILDFYMCSVIMREDEWLVPYAISADAPPDGSRRMRVDQGLVGKTFQTGESYVIDEVTNDDDTDPAKESYRSAISVPVGDHGVFQAVSTEPHAFDAQDVEFAELLVSHTASVVEQIEREGVLRRQNDRLEAFASIVSHDLRNPLNVATGRLELAREECNSTHLDHAAMALDRMDALIEDMLTLSRQGNDVRETEPVDLAVLSETCWETVETAEAAFSIETVRTIQADRNRLQQLLENLFRNAIEHGGDDVTVTVGSLDERPGFYVEDDGSGIPVDERETVFESGYSTSATGTGLGLAIVTEIADAHGWEIDVTESTSGGSRFEISNVELVR